MEQIEVIDSIIMYLVIKNWKEIFSNRPGNNFGTHGGVVPIKGKIVDGVLLKNDQLLLIECDSKISLKDNYDTKLYDIKEYLNKDDNLSRWIRRLEIRNQIKIGKINQIILALAYHQLDSRMKLKKPDLVFKGFYLFRVTEKGKVIEEHLIEYSKLNKFISNK